MEIVGTPLRHDVFFVANHVSWIDILALGGATGTAFISKDDVEGWPVVGWLAKQNNTLFVSRDRRHGISGQIDRVRAAMAGHQPVALFPEGTTSDGITLLPFKPSLLAVMMPPPRALRVQPVYVDYGPAAPEIAWLGEEGAGENALRVMSRPGPLRLKLHFLEPFDPAAFPDRKALSAETRARIAACMNAPNPSAGPTKPEPV